MRAKMESQSEGVKTCLDKDTPKAQNDKNNL